MPESQTCNRIAISNHNDIVRFEIAESVESRAEIASEIAVIQVAAISNHRRASLKSLVTWASKFFRLGHEQVKHKRSNAAAGERGRRRIGAAERGKMRG